MSGGVTRMAAVIAALWPGAAVAQAVALLAG